jgi:hypothetical protein
MEGKGDWAVRKMGVYESGRSSSWRGSKSRGCKKKKIRKRKKKGVAWSTAVMLLSQGVGLQVGNEEGGSSWKPSRKSREKVREGWQESRPKGLCGMQFGASDE